MAQANPINPTPTLSDLAIAAANLAVAEYDAKINTLIFDKISAEYRPSQYKFSVPWYLIDASDVKDHADKQASAARTAYKKAISDLDKYMSPEKAAETRAGFDKALANFFAATTKFQAAAAKFEATAAMFKAAAAMFKDVVAKFQAAEAEAAAEANEAPHDAADHALEVAGTFTGHTLEVTGNLAAPAVDHDQA